MLNYNSFIYIPKKSLIETNKYAQT